MCAQGISHPETPPGRGGSREMRGQPIRAAGMRRSRVPYMLIRRTRSHLAAADTDLGRLIAGHWPHAFCGLTGDVDVNVEVDVEVVGAKAGNIQIFPMTASPMPAATPPSWRAVF